MPQPGPRQGPGQVEEHSKKKSLDYAGTRLKGFKGSDFTTTEASLLKP